MEFFRGKMGILTALLCLAALAGIVWFCLFGADRSAIPDGTLVYGQSEGNGRSFAICGSEASGDCNAASGVSSAASDVSRAASGVSRAASGCWKETAVKLL